MNEEEYENITLDEYFEQTTCHACVFNVYCSHYGCRSSSFIPDPFCSCIDEKDYYKSVQDYLDKLYYEEERNDMITWILDNKAKQEGVRLSSFTNEQLRDLINKWRMAREMMK